MQKYDLQRIQAVVAICREKFSPGTDGKLHWTGYNLAARIIDWLEVSDVPVALIRQDVAFLVSTGVLSFRPATNAERKFDIGTFGSKMYTWCLLRPSVRITMSGGYCELTDN